MVVISDNLKELIEQHEIVDDKSRFDNFSITLTLSKEIAKYIEKEEVITYGQPINEDNYTRETMDAEGITLKPHDSFLGCSKEKIKIPNGYIGFIQTKGSLARLFISVHCTDSQIETGFE